MTDKDQPNAIVLPVGAAASAEAQGFPGMPGRYLPGEPVLLRTVDLTAEEARSLIRDLNVPLELVDHGKRKEALPVPDENPPRGESGTFESAELTPQAPLEGKRGEDAPAAAVVAAAAVAAAAEEKSTGGGEG